MKTKRGKNSNCKAKKFIHSCPIREMHVIDVIDDTTFLPSVTNEARQVITERETERLQSSFVK